jgi:hypothetical protein
MPPPYARHRPHGREDGPTPTATARRRETALLPPPRAAAPASKSPGQVVTGSSAPTSTAGAEINQAASVATRAPRGFLLRSTARGAKG